MIICGTGHRPDKLGGYTEAAMYPVYKTALNYLGNSGFVTPITKVISGGALGWDQQLAHAAIAQGVHLTMALPFKDFDSRWPRESREFLEFLVSSADEVVYVCEDGYAPWKMQERNKWMVDNSDSVLALWNGTDGGTANCVRYAEKVGKPIINLWEMYAAKQMEEVPQRDGDAERIRDEDRNVSGQQES